ncbi:hypothetical protein KP509_1Z185900 [Ceratopteris richardii]|nr:hypothetical protein KP509_1Z185900 [Ceratopteris richardii]
MLSWEEQTLAYEWLGDVTYAPISPIKDNDSEQGFLDKQMKEFINNQVMISSYPVVPTRATSPSMRSSSSHMTGTSSVDMIQTETEDNSSEDELKPSSNEVCDAGTNDELCREKAFLEVVDAYQRALRPLQFEEANLLSTFYYRHKLLEQLPSMSTKVRARAISQEMTILNTTLPLEWGSSIFLRIDNTRTDVIRALITGPENTPYENGMFLFDILLKASYPFEPPEVHFLTTGGGKVRFNPNLYANGHVCLSLLGTWMGPGWEPSKSNLMQVLLSIQGLVLVADPLYNEPGSETWGTHNAVEEYNCAQRFNTLQYSILPALMSSDPVFLPVIRTHFRLKAPYVRNQCIVWMEQDPNSTRKQQYITLVEQINRKLDELTATV